MKILSTALLALCLVGCKPESPVRIQTNTLTYPNLVDTNKEIRITNNFETILTNTDYADTLVVEGQSNDIALVVDTNGNLEIKNEITNIFIWSWWCNVTNPFVTISIPAGLSNHVIWTK